MQSQPITEPDPAMESLVEFRSGLYRSLTGWADAAFELCDAALGAPAPVDSIPKLSLEPAFRRSHASIWEPPPTQTI